jgi:DNA replication and repair protein RecF
LKRIRIHSLRLQNFRNYEKLDCVFDEHVNVITGLNGAGKTSILDAIYYLSNGKSYFSHLDSHIYRKSADYFNLRSTHFIGDDKFEISIVSGAEVSKQIKVDEKQMKSIVEYVGRFPAFMIAPKDILILVESSVERRKIIDKTISQVDPLYFKNLIEYNKLLKQRNAALKGFLKSGRQDFLMLDAIDGRMEEPAVYIYEARKNYLQEITPSIQALYDRLSDNSESVSISYKSNLDKNSLRELFQEYRQRDLIMAKTHQGIHRDDIKINLDGLDIRKIGSQGQLKSAIIAIKLAQVEWVRGKTSKAALILLDDIFDKLDSTRVMNLLDICASQLNAQIFISDTESERVNTSLDALKLNYSHYKIKDAKILNGG